MVFGQHLVLKILNIKENNPSFVSLLMLSKIEKLCCLITWWFLVMYIWLWETLEVITWSCFLQLVTYVYFQSTIKIAFCIIMERMGTFILNKWWRESSSLFQGKFTYGANFMSCRISLHFQSTIFKLRNFHLCHKKHHQLGCRLSLLSYIRWCQLFLEMIIGF